MNLDTKRIRIIKDTQHTSAFNMACDEVLFTQAIVSNCNCGTVRFYSFNPFATTIGLCQPICQEAELATRIAGYADVTRRITGGGLVVHNNDLPYTCIFRSDMHSALKGVNDSYRFIHSLIQKTFLQSKITCDLHSQQKASFSGTGACFVNPVDNDLMCAEQKIAGAAQKRKKGWILHQGSISFDHIDHDLLSREEFIYTFLDCIKTELQIDFYEDSLSDKEKELIRQLENDKYTKREWILRR